MTVRLRCWVLVVAMVAAAAMAAPSASAATSGKKIVMGGSVTALTINEPVSFVPAAVNGFGSSADIFYALIYDALWWYNPKTQEPIPRFAESIKPNTDLTVWTIKLKKGLKFTDGTVFDAAAVVSYWNQVKVPAFASICQTTIAGFTSYVATDPQTVTITLPEGRAALPQQLSCALMIPSPTAVTKYGTTYGTSPETTVGAGPFILKELVKGDHATYVKNTAFWDAPRPYLDQITLKPTPDENTEVNALISGSAQLAQLVATGPATTRAKTAGLKSYALSEASTYLGEFNTTVAPLNDDRVRQALILAYNPGEISTKAFDGQATMAESFFPKDSPFYSPAQIQKDNNLAKAQKLIDAYVAEKGGPVTFKLLTIPTYAAINTTLQQQWTRLKNVNVQLDSISVTAATVRVRARDYQFFPRTNGAENIEQINTAFATGNAGNHLNWSDPALDKLMAAARIAKPGTKAQQSQLAKIGDTLMANHWFLLLNRVRFDTFVTSAVTVRGMRSPRQIDPTTVSLTKKP